MASVADLADLADGLPFVAPGIFDSFLRSTRT